MNDVPERRWYQFSLRRLLLATAVFSLGCGIAALDPRQIGMHTHGPAMFFVFIMKPILLASIGGWALGIIFRRQMAGYTIGLTLGMAYMIWFAFNES
jgi:hypothetical protein